MPNLFDDFLNQVLSQIRCKQAHESVRAELKNHLEDQAEAYETHGKDPETARQEAVRQMGDPVIIGGQLDAVHRPRPDWLVLVLAMVLMAGGAILQLLLNIAFPSQYDAGYSLVLGICLGLAAMLIPYFLDYTLIAKRPLFLYIAVCSICVLPYLFLSQSLVFLARPPFWLGGTGTANHYVSYTAFLFIPVLCGLIYSQKNRGMSGMLYCILFMLPPAAICILSFNFSTFAILYASFFILLAAAIGKSWFGERKAQSFLLLLVPTVVFLAALALSGKLNFVTSTFDTYGNQNITSIYYIFDHAHWLSQPTVWQNLKPSSLPAVFYDSRYWLVGIIAQFGWVPGLGVVAGIALLLWRLFASAFRQKNALGFFLCLSVALLIAFQCLTFILMNLGISTDGANGLPLIFNRASGMAVNMLLIGLYLSACKFGKTGYARSFLFERNAKV